MAKFELQTTDAFSSDSRLWPQEYVEMCETLMYVVQHGIIEPTYSTTKRTRTDIIVLPDSQAAAFVAAVQEELQSLYSEGRVEQSA